MNFAQPIRWSDNDRYWGPFTYARERGSERGVTIMLGSGELHEGAFRRYCAEHQMTFVGVHVEQPA